MLEREQAEITDYNETHGVRPTSETITSGLLEAMSPRQSRPVSMLSVGKGSVLEVSSIQI